ncbi:MAG: T9SS type A sorting domain-containing protein [Chitinophagaceae bacterium]
MKKFNIYILLVILILCTQVGISQAQVTGTKTIPGDYPTLNDAIIALNTSGVGAGGATINLTQPETAPVGGYKIGSATLNASTTAANPLVINGGNHIITAQVGTGAGTSTALPDAIVWVIGTDHITLNQLNLVESASNITITTQMEAGILIRSMSTTDASQFLTIQNCSINLNGTATLTTSAGIYETGIALQVAPATQATSPISTTAVLPTSADGVPGNIVIKGNTIQNCYNGINILGSSSATYYSPNITIGGANATDGNHLSNLGSKAPEGGVAVAANSTGIYVSNVSNSNISHNNITAANIYNGFYFIQAGTDDGTRIVRNNDMQGSMIATNTSSLYCIFNTGGSTNSFVDSNHIHDIIMNTTGNFYGVYNGLASISGFHSSNANVINNITRTPTLGTAVLNSFCIFSSALSNVNYREINNNTVSNFTHTTAATGGASLYALYNANSQHSEAKNNLVSNLIINGTGTNTCNVYGMFSGSSINEHKIDSNTFSGLHIMHTPTAAASVYGIYSNAATGTHHIYNNNVNSLSTASANGSIEGISLLQAASGGRSVYNNMVSGLTAPSLNIDNAVKGIYASGGTNNIYYNTIYLGSAGTLTSTGTNYGVSGISWLSSATVEMINNIINVKATPAGNGKVSALRVLAAGTNGTVPSSYNSNSNNNILYAPNAANSYLYVESALGNASVFNAYGISNDPDFNTSCGLFKTFAAPAESATFTEDNLTAGAIPNTFLPNGASFAKSSALSIASVPFDFSGATRTNPSDIGALEFTGTSVDASAPLINYNVLQNTLCLNNPYIDADITDLSGVNTTTNKPRVWFKKSTENNVLPASNTSVDNGWKYVEATNTTSPFHFDLNYSLLSSPVIAGDIIEYFVIAQDLQATPNVGKVSANFPTSFCPTSVALSASAFPISSPNSYSITVPPTTIVATATPYEFCVSGAPLLSTTNNNAVSGLEYQWESSPSGANTFTEIPGATTLDYTSATLTSNTDFRLKFACSGIPFDTSDVVTVIVNNPLVSSTTPSTICGPHSTTVSATTLGGYNIRWYDNAVGGNLLHIGNTYTTPFLTSGATYYALAAAGNSVNGGRQTATATGAASGIANRGIVFTTTAALTIDSIGLMSTGNAVDVTIKLYNSTGTTQIGSDVVLSIPTNSGNTIIPKLEIIPTLINVPAAGTYRLVVSGLSTAGNHLYGETSGVTGYPYAVGTQCSITGTITSTIGSATTSACYYIYKLALGKVCEGIRVPVDVTYTIPPSVTLTATSDSVCFQNQTSSTLSLTSVNDPNYDYTWSPATGLNTTTGASVMASPSTATTYTINASDATSGCVTIFTKQIGIYPQFTVASNVTPALVCALDSATLNVVTATPTGFVPSAYSWSPASGYANANAANTKVNTYYTQTYTVTASDSHGCTATSTTELTVHPLISGTPSATPDNFCVGGTTTINSTVSYSCLGNDTNFVGTYAPANWSLVNTNSNGSISTVFIPSQLGINSGTNGSFTDGTTSFEKVIICPGTVSFSWNYFTTDIAYTDRPQYQVNSNTPVLMTGFNIFGGSTQSGTQTITVNAGDTLKLQMWTFDNDGISATVNISNFIAPKLPLTGSATVWDAATGGNMLGTPPYTFVPNANQGYYIEYTQYSTNCVNPIRELVPLTVNPLPTIITSAMPNDSICIGNDVTLGAMGAQDYVWMGNPTLSSDTILTPAVAGIYSVLGTDANGCSNTATIEIFINPLPTVVANPASQTVCQNSSVSIAGGGADMYVWTGGIIDNTPFTALADETYTVTGTDANGCSNTATAEVLIDLLPTLSVTASPSNTVCFQSAVTIEATGASTYMLNSNMMTGSDTSFVTFAPNTYTITATNASGCTATTSISISVNSLSGNLALSTGGASVIGTTSATQVHPDGANLNYTDINCDLIVIVNDGMGGTQLGSTLASVTVDNGVQLVGTQPYVPRWYTITPTNTNVTAQVKMYLHQDDFDLYNTYALANGWPLLPTSGNNADPNIANIRVTKTDAAGAQVLTPTMFWNGTMWEATMLVTSFSEFRFHSVNPLNAPLPATVLNFTGVKEGSADRLSWTSVQEINSANYIIAYSQDGINFKPVAQVPSKAINGNSQSALNYIAMHSQPALGHNYYKLQLQDIDGRITQYDKVIDLMRSADGNTVIVYPNPASDIIHIDVYTTKEQKAEVKLMDMSARVIKSVQASLIQGTNEISMQLSDLASGMYTIQVSTNNTVISTSKIQKN